MDEDALIRRYFSFDADASTLIRGPGDDAALLELSGKTCVISTDLFLQGPHFDADDDPADLGYKALAVNLSDLAAMGASPVCFTLGLVLPQIEEDWIAAFSDGLKGLAREVGIALAGGDLSRGVRAACITVVGVLKGEAPALRRDVAQAGDQIWVTGTLGDAALARLHPDHPGIADCLARLHRPEPRLAFGQRIRGHARAAMDVSDGIFKDFQRLLKASSVGATVELTKIPLSESVAAEREKSGDWFALLSGGEDYELVFTAPDSEAEEIQRIGQELDVPVACIGLVNAESELALTENGETVALPERLGYDHFAPA